MMSMHSQRTLYCMRRWMLHEQSDSIHVVQRQNSIHVSYSCGKQY